MGRRVSSLLVLAAMSAAAPAADQFNVDLEVGWDSYFRPGQWAPIDVTISSNLHKPFGGRLVLTAQQDELTRMIIARKIALTPDLPLHVPLTTKLAFGAEKCSVRIEEEGSFRRWSFDFTVWQRNRPERKIKPVPVQDLLIGVVGGGKFGLMHLPNGSECSGSGGGGQVHAVRKQTRMLPWDWTGYASLDLLVLYDVDAQRIRPQQADAIVRWVGNGGAVLVVLGSRPVSDKSPLAALLPFRPGKTRQVKVSADRLRRWGCRPGPRAKLTGSLACWSIPTRLEGGWQVTWTAGHSPRQGRLDPEGHALTNAPLLAHGPLGFGRVGVLTCDPAAVGGHQRENVAEFWVEQIRPLLAGRNIRHADRRHRSDRPDNYWQYDLGLAGNASNAVLEHLLSIPELRPLSIWVVIGLLVVLAIVIGPVDYFVLKRLDRLPLTWVTSATCVVVFTIAAYYGVRALRAGEAQVRMVSVLDGVDRGGTTWATTYSGIFAPVSADYRLERLRPDQWWSSVVPTEGSHLYSYSSSTGSREVYCAQGEGGSLPFSLPINIWSMQCLISEGPGGKMPFAARLRRRGEGIELEIQNLSDRPVRSGFVRLGGNRVMRFAAVPPKSKRTFPGRAVAERKAWERCVKASSGHVPTGSVSRFTGEQVGFAWGSLQRTRRIEKYLTEGAAVVCAWYDDPPADFALRRRNAEFRHTRLARLVVFPEEG